MFFKYIFKMLNNWLVGQLHPENESFTSRGSIVIIATSFGLDSLGFKSQQKQEIFSFRKLPKTGSGARASSCSMGRGVLSWE
jgi:hypothetical protein